MESRLNRLWVKPSINEMIKRVWRRLKSAKGKNTVREDTREVININKL